MSPYSESICTDVAILVYKCRKYDMLCAPYRISGNFKGFIFQEFRSIREI